MFYENNKQETTEIEISFGQAKEDLTYSRIYNHRLNRNRRKTPGLNDMRPVYKPVEHKWFKRQIIQPALVQSPEATIEDPSLMNVVSKQAQLQNLLQELYEAEAEVRMEAGEVSRTREVAAEAQQALEEAANQVRMLSTDLQSAQERAASVASKAQAAQIQVAAHDKLMFEARQRADSLSEQMVGFQAQLASAQQSYALGNTTQLLEQQGRPSFAANPDFLIPEPSEYQEHALYPPFAAQIPPMGLAVPRVDPNRYQKFINGINKNANYPNFII
ncbi:hypothetical protein AAG570_011224 [Ranatra chinensis]|uniref:Uncharacterized protein n=1 Tax=Ranatra chinensis TaxID=642074 RepID=A0ABD0YK29_9HEMI